MNILRLMQLFKRPYLKPKWSFSKIPTSMINSLQLFIRSLALLGAKLWPFKGSQDRCFFLEWFPLPIQQKYKSGRQQDQGQGSRTTTKCKEVHPVNVNSLFALRSDHHIWQIPIINYQCNEAAERLMFLYQTERPDGSPDANMSEVSISSTNYQKMHFHFSKNSF